MNCVKIMRLDCTLWRWRHSVGVTICMLLVGCGGNQPELAVWLKDGQMSQVGEEGGYPLVMVRKKSGVVQRVYIEGDGRAYITSSETSGDPTPINPVGLKLFMEDPAQDVMFMGRPCQWARTPVCKDRGIWTTGRFTQEMADIYVQAIARETQGQPVELVGYSGGAWIAMQVAARLPNVTGVRTVAGNVDPDEVNRVHGVTPIKVAGWPEVNRLHDVPQLHVVGARDKIVPAEVLVNYMLRVKPRCAQVESVDADHAGDWVAAWPKLLAEPLPCGKEKGPR